VKLSKSSKEPQRKPDLAYFERNHPIFKLLVVAMKYSAIVVIAVFGPARAAELLRLFSGS
jgi:hypothetical protein